MGAYELLQGWLSSAAGRQGLTPSESGPEGMLAGSRAHTPPPRLCLESKALLVVL